MVTRRRRQTSTGFTLLETIIGLSIGLTALIGFIGVTTAGNRLTKKSLSTIDIASIKRNIFAGVSCERTFRGLPIGDPCNGSPRYIDLKTADDRVMVSSNGTGSGSYVVRAYCSDGANRGLDIRIVKLMPAFLSNVEDISWIGHSTPPNPSHYMTDESRSSSISYDWNHPSSILSTPGPGGLCASSFQAFAATTACTDANQYVQSYNFDTKVVTCKPIPTCGATQTLEFAGSDFNCSNERYNNMVSWFTSYVNSSIPATQTTIDSYRNSANGYMDYVYNRFGQLGSRANGSTTSIGASNDSGCALLSNGSCPDGYLMYGYEARNQGMGNCHSLCVRIAPP